MSGEETRPPNRSPEDLRRSFYDGDRANMQFEYLAHMAIEAAGMPTSGVAVSAFRHRMEVLAVPRALDTAPRTGHSIGPAGDRARQRSVATAALDVLEAATEPGGHVTFDAAGSP